LVRGVSQKTNGGDIKEFKAREAFQDWERARVRYLRKKPLGEPLGGKGPDEHPPPKGGGLDRGAHWKIAARDRDLILHPKEAGGPPGRGKNGEASGGGGGGGHLANAKGEGKTKKREAGQQRKLRGNPPSGVHSQGGWQGVTFFPPEKVLKKKKKTAGEGYALE